MNGKKHAALPEWVFSELHFEEGAQILDVGCGGGANLARMLKLCPTGHVTGLDMSQLALEESKDINYHAYVDKLCSIVGGNATQMPLAKNMFDIVTAFETIYYWPSLQLGASEIYRVLKPGTVCVIANEMDGEEPGAHALEKAVTGIRIYTIDEIIEDLTETGFTQIEPRHDEERHFVCVTARKPLEE
jgi:ubiquinone/menaquinone biosynthesis C-methylase UbiE